MTIFVGYWLYVVHNWLYIAKYGAKSVNLTHDRHISYIEQEHSSQRRRRELAAIKFFFLQMIGFILIDIDLMILLFQRLQKQNLLPLPLIVGNVWIFSFIYPPEVGFQMWDQ